MYIRNHRVLSQHALGLALTLRSVLYAQSFRGGGCAVVTRCWLEGQLRAPQGGLRVVSSCDRRASLTWGLACRVLSLKYPGHVCGNWLLPTDCPSGGVAREWCCLLKGSQQTDAWGDNAATRTIAGLKRWYMIYSVSNLGKHFKSVIFLYPWHSYTAMTLLHQYPMQALQLPNRKSYSSWQDWVKM